jgi:hypothetical protein
VESLGLVKSLKVEAKTPVLIFCKETKENESSEDDMNPESELGNLATEILISQCFYDESDKYRYLKNNQKVLKKVQNGFLP